MTGTEAEHSKRAFSYVGRPDGLGNRFEEIIRLETICSSQDLECEYLWSNQYQHRSYGVWFRTRNVRVIESGVPSHDPKLPADFGVAWTQADLLAAAQAISPAFDAGFDGGIRPVGVHIRGSDRIGQDHPHFMRDEAELYQYLSGAADWVNTTRPRHLFVCADDPAYRETFLKHVDAGIEVVEPRRDPKVPPEYVDFFALARCGRICMASRFSSFAIAASLIAKAPLVALVRDETVRERYLALFEYHLDFDRERIKPAPRQEGFLQRARKRLRLLTRGR